MSPVGHTAIGLLSWQKLSEKKNLRTLVLFILIANLPDIDFGLFFLFGRRGLEMHQNYTHNVFFVGLTVLLFLPFFKEKKERIGIFITAYSHLLLDYLTIDGAAPFGFRLFFPLSEQRFNLGVLPNLWKADWYEVFSLHNLWVICFEIAFFLLPVLLLYGKTINGHLKKEIQNR